MSNDGKIIEKRWVITCEYDPKNCCISLTFHPDLILDLLVFKNKYNNESFYYVKNNTPNKDIENLNKKL